MLRDRRGLLLMTPAAQHTLPPSAIHSRQAELEVGAERGRKN